jgi:hypothetical protein
VLSYHALALAVQLATVAALLLLTARCAPQALVRSVLSQALKLLSIAAAPLSKQLALLVGAATTDAASAIFISM